MTPEHRWVLDTLGAATADEAELERVFAHLARLEERDGPRDVHGRFPHSESRTDPLGVPVEQLRASLGIEPPRWCGAKFAVALTHDVDVVWRWTARGVKGALWRARRGDLRHLLDLARAPLHRARGTDPWWRFRELVEAERAHGARSTFFVLGGHGAPEDGPDWGPLRALLLETLVELGGEIGLHPSYRAADDAARLAGEKRALERLAGPVAGSRYHYLRVDPHRNLRPLAELGLAYDASVGWPGALGFRAGTTHPYRPWDAERRAPLDLVEIPTAAMDATLAEPHYLGLSVAEAERRLHALLDVAERHGGGFAVIWHTERFDPATARGWDRLYFRFVDEVHARGGACVSAGELAAEARARLFTMPS